MAKVNKSLFAPVIVLVCICLVASFLLAGVYQITKPVIDERTEETKSAARKKVLPDGNSFVQVTDVELPEGVVDCFKADNGAGYVFSVENKGMEAGLKLMIGIDINSMISGISVIEHNETAGIGTKVLADDNLAKFVGCTSEDKVDGVTGATFTSKGVALGVSNAFAAYELVTK